MPSSSPREGEHEGTLLRTLRTRLTRHASEDSRTALWCAQISAYAPGRRNKKEVSKSSGISLQLSWFITTHRNATPTASLFSDSQPHLLVPRQVEPAVHRLCTTPCSVRVLCSLLALYCLFIAIAISLPMFAAMHQVPRKPPPCTATSNFWQLSPKHPQ